MSFADWKITGLAQLTRLVGLERLCLRYMWVQSDVPWGESGGRDWEQVLAACSKLTRLEFDCVVCEEQVSESEGFPEEVRGFRFRNMQEPPPVELVDRMTEAISEAHSLKELVLRDRMWPDAHAEPYTWQERLARVQPQMQSLTKLSFVVMPRDLQPCVQRAAAVASMMRGENVTVAGEHCTDMLYLSAAQLGS